MSSFPMERVAVKAFVYSEINSQTGDKEQYNFPN